MTTIEKVKKEQVKQNFNYYFYGHFTIIVRNKLIFLF